MNIILTALVLPILATGNQASQRHELPSPAALRVEGMT